MKTIGLIGGISWHSTEVYYRSINQMMNEILGGAHSAKLLLYSVDYNEIAILQAKNDWPQIAIMLSEIAVNLEKAGADCMVMCCNTTHVVAEQISEKIKIPFLHIAEATAGAIAKRGIKKIGLLGTTFTMESSFFKDKLSAKNIDVMTPTDLDKEYVHTSILNEFSKGIFKQETKEKYLDIISKMKMAGAQGIIFGCTEINLLLNQSDCDVVVFDTAYIHAKAAVEFAISKSN